MRDDSAPTTASIALPASSRAGHRGGLIIRPPAGWAELVAFLFALVPRVGMVVHSAGFRGTYGYDASVYYGAAAALVNGRAPYRDFTLLHPPGVALVLAPFAWLGDHTTDHTGFIAATMAFIGIGAVNAALVVRVARRLGLGDGPALVAGLWYAAWPGAVIGEYLIRLEPLGNLLLLGGLLAYTHGTEKRRWPVLCGVSLGAAVAVKIWFLVPLLVIFGWRLARDRRSGALLAVGAAGSALVVVGPFVLLAPHRAWSMIVTEQAVRALNGTPTARLTGVTGIGAIDGNFASRYSVVVISLGLAAAVALCRTASRVRGSGLPLTLFLAQLAVLGAAPSWFTFYADFLAPGLSLTVAFAARRVADLTADRGRRSRRLAAPAFGVAIVVLVAVMISARRTWVRPYPAAQLRPAVAGARCVMSDAPMPLIELDVLTRDLRHGCPNWVDVDGTAYGLHASGMATRRASVRWQRALRRYLLSGDRLTRYWPHDPGFGPELTRTMRRLPVLARSGRFRVWLTTARSGGRTAR